MRQLVALYLPELKQRPIGKPFPEVYNPVTLKPLPEWQGMYEEVKLEMQQMGLAVR